jgi:tRNA U34 5-methylaminomethyl-2-thiouridine-forming methyltransferase MnmC
VIQSGKRNPCWNRLPATGLEITKTLIDSHPIRDPTLAAFALTLVLRKSLASIMS